MVSIPGAWQVWRVRDSFWSPKACLSLHGKTGAVSFCSVVLSLLDQLTGKVSVHGLAIWEESSPSSSCGCSVTTRAEMLFSLRNGHKHTQRLFNLCRQPPCFEIHFKAYLGSARPSLRATMEYCARRSRSGVTTFVRYKCIVASQLHTHQARTTVAFQRTCRELGSYNESAVLSLLFCTHNAPKQPPSTPQ